MNTKLASVCLALAAAALVGPASAADPKAPAAPRQCFFSRDWQGWRAPDDRTIIIRVHLNDYYKLALSHRCPELRDPSAHIVNIVRGSDTICGPLDLDLKVATDPGFATPCLVKSMSKMSKAEIDAVPKKFRP